MNRNCDSCGTALEKVWPEANFSRRHDDHVNYKNALHLRLFGGFAEYIDAIFSPADDIIICGKCADTLLADNPWLKNIVNPEPLRGKNAPRE